MGNLKTLSSSCWRVNVCYLQSSVISKMFTRGTFLEIENKIKQKGKVTYD